MLQAAKEEHRTQLQIGHGLAASKEYLLYSWVYELRTKVFSQLLNSQVERELKSKAKLIKWEAQQEF